jgi:hypothetical protein
VSGYERSAKGRLRSAFNDVLMTQAKTGGETYSFTAASSQDFHLAVFPATAAETDFVVTGREPVKRYRMGRKPRRTGSRVERGDRASQGGDGRRAQVDDGSAVGDERLHLIPERVGDHSDHDEDGGDATEEASRSIGDAILEVAQLESAFRDDCSVALRHATAAADDDHRALRLLLRHLAFAASL